MFGEISRILQDATEKLMRLKLLDMRELFYTSMTSNNAVGQTTIATEAFTIRQKNESVLPADKITTKLHDRAIWVV